ncbi:MAG: type I restriction-modification system subunit M N-terminal domain-containing protein [Parapedobacter sp.]
MDGWDFKSYVLGILFYRFISENLAVHINKGERETGNADFNFAQLSDEEAEFGRKDTVAEKGFFILPSELFTNVRKNAASNPNLNVGTMNLLMRLYPTRPIPSNGKATPIRS